MGCLLKDIDVRLELAQQQFAIMLELWTTLIQCIHVGYVLGDGIQFSGNEIGVVVDGHGDEAERRTRIRRLTTTIAPAGGLAAHYAPCFEMSARIAGFVIRPIRIAFKSKRLLHPLTSPTCFSSTSSSLSTRETSGLS